MDLFAAIDIRGGKSVRLAQGDFARESVYGDPVERARQLLGDGAVWLHVVDLDAALSGVRANRSVVERIVQEARLRGVRVQAGGGIRDDAAAREVLESGVDRAVLGTAALADPEMVMHLAATFPGRIAVGLDYRIAAPEPRAAPLERSDHPISSMMLASAGWTSGGQISMEDALTWFEGSGVAAIVVTDIGRDGMLAGPDVEGLTTILASTEISLIASGGVATLDDLRSLRRISSNDRELGGVVVGKALVEGHFDVAEAMGILRGDSR